jgi:hypothetical protein
MAKREPDQPQFTVSEVGKELLERLRDAEGNSWAKVATALGLGSPGAARRAYTALTGRHHTASVLPGRASKGGAVQPVNLAGSTLDAIREAIAGRTIVVQRKGGNEEILVAKVTSLKAGTVNFNDGAKSRSVKAEAIVAVK